MKTITITDEDYDLCVMVAAMRNMVSRASNTKDRQMGNQSALETDLTGIIGEYAFCKLHNIFPDLIAKTRSGSYDCFFKGQRIDIKTTKYEDGRLLATTKLNDDVDVYVLAIVNGKSVTFPGWTRKSQLIKEENLKNLGHGETYVMDQEKLNPWKEPK
jgi:hypothetical protein